jgi:uncharacterized protein YqjF (DUF2071 family)
MGGTFLRADWRTLAMLNFDIDPAVLDPLIPAGTELDFHERRTFVSVVGFRFLKAWVLGLTLPFHRNFDEVNLRFYVRRRVGGSWRRGVVFVKEIVPRRLIAWMARRCFYENFVALPMRSAIALPTPSHTGAVDVGRPFPAEVGLEGPTYAVTYEWLLGKRWNRLSASISGKAFRPSPESVETFIAEHYWGYTRTPDGGTVEFEVEHPPWRIWRAKTARIDIDIAELYGEDFVAALSAPPSSAFVADGSAVVVRKGHRLDTAICARDLAHAGPPP